jgi:hypothetical protein
MGLFDFIFKKKEIDVANHNDGYFKTLTAYQPHFSTWGGELYESALVRSAIDARARHISKLKVEIQGAARPTLQTKLRLKPNNWQTWSQFLYRTSTILDMHNTCVIVPVYDELMNPVGYYPVLPRKCDIVEVEGVPLLRYEFSDGVRACTYLEECAILTKFQYKSDFFGEKNTALDPTMKLIHLDNEAVEEAVKNNARFSFIAKVGNFTKNSDLKKEQARFNESSFRGEDSSGVLLFPNTYSEIKQIEQKSYTVPEAELNEIRTNVYNYFAVNEDILQSKAFGDAWSAFYESVVEPFAIQFSETMSQACFSDKERAMGSMIMATSNRLQYMTTKEKLDVSAQMADRGILSFNEIREIWNLPPIDDGDRRIIRGEYYNADEKISELEGEGNANQEK